jgi:2-desacetyl-2-hydroxyethyl bacteriochlorophyllide A dehydrogenase
MPHRIQFLDKGVVDYTPFEREPVGPGEVRMVARLSLISTGTEGICLHRMFEPETHWDEWVKYPFRSGYCLLGTIDEVGSDVVGLKVGQRVVSRAAHASEAVVKASQALPVPEELSDDQAVWFALATIGFMGAKAGQFKLGDYVLVVGAGPVGQMALRWAVAGGARHAVILDPIAARLEMARQGGATGVIQGLVGEIPLEPYFDGQLPRVVVDATGHAPLFAKCLRLPRHSGTVVLLGDSGTPSKQHLTLDVVRRGIKIHGAHISHETPEWTEQTVVDFFFDLCRRGRFNVDELITHRFPSHQCKEAFALTTDRRDETMGVVFDW